VRNQAPAIYLQEPPGDFLPQERQRWSSSQQEAPFGVFAANAIQLPNALLAAFADSFHREITLPHLWVRPDGKMPVAQFAAEKTPSAFRHDANTAPPPPTSRPSLPTTVKRRARQNLSFFGKSLFYGTDQIHH